MKQNAESNGSPSINKENEGSTGVSDKFTKITYKKKIIFLKSKISEFVER